MKVVEITWLDAWSNAGPKEVGEIEASLIELRTVGYLVKESDSAIVIAQELYPEDDGRFRYIQCIPKVLIKKRKVLRAK